MKSTAAAALTVLMVTMLFASLPPPVHASSVLVQQNNTGCAGCSAPVSVSFPNPVAAGDVAVVAIAATGAGSATVTSVSDTQGSLYTQAATSTDGDDVVYIYLATLASSAGDTVTVAFQDAEIAQNVYIFEVSNVATAEALTSNDAGSGGASIFTGSVPFGAGAFLLGVIGTLDSFADTGMTVAPGAGFTLATENSNTGFSHVQYATSGVSSPTTFPATIASPTEYEFWAEAGIALLPPGSVVVTSTSTVTETVSSTITSTTTATTTVTSTSTLLIPTSTSLSCDQSTLNVNRNTYCTAAVNDAVQGVLGGTVSWSVSPAGSGTFSREQCPGAPAGPGSAPPPPPPPNEESCYAQFTPSTTGALTITATYSGDAYNAPSSHSFVIFVGTSSSTATSLSLVCDQVYLGVTQNTNCHATVTAANGGRLTGTVAWSVSPSSGTFSQQQCSNHPPAGPAPNSQLECNARFTPSASGILTITATYSETDGNHASSSDTFVIYVG